jgi:hypothetical protein
MADDMADFDRQEAARDHLTRRYAPEIAGEGAGFVLADLDAMQRVRRAAQRPHAELDVADVRAALTLLPAAREDLEILELRLLAHVRRDAPPGRAAVPPLPSRSWLTWEEIASTLGVSRQAAEQRYGRLQERYSGITLPTPATTERANPIPLPDAADVPRSVRDAYEQAATGDGGED